MASSIDPGRGDENEGDNGLWRSVERYLVRRRKSVCKGDLTKLGFRIKPSIYIMSFGQSEDSSVLLP